MRYRTVVVDPPWPYEGKLEGTLGPTSKTHAGPMPYAVMPLEDIIASLEHISLTPNPDEGRPAPATALEDRP